MRILLRRARRVLLALLLAVVTGLLLALVVVPLVMGWVPLTVLSGSMEPTIPTGSQVVVQPVETLEEAAQLTTGDVITFMPHPDDPTLVTHRVVGVALGADGEPSFTTQGDNNSAPDEESVTAVQLRGVVQYHVPYAGYLATALDFDQKRMGVVLAAVALLGYALWQLVGALRYGGRRTVEVTEDVAEPVSPPEARRGRRRS